ncbi:class I SAM-dependent methyltransferase [Geomonas sp.]|uniref:class I SAM-dependent methyltransferase n=1 Tax=Geomonas sp. TaxID=2651584 RepID=UPI002B471FBC|nr:methyltransferase domain-containing protein [Geomonas sp.]HJV34915.1 methyltransferase domain-containing protein [Geomonas sp.]
MDAQNVDEQRSRHQAEIVEQFSRQSVTFTQVPGHYDALQVLIAMSEVSASDQVLDVACGPGIVACEFARHAESVTGIDITPAMIEQAAKRQQEAALTNLAWLVGDALPLPFPDDAFSLVVTRYSFHHLLSPAQALREMIRVCRPGGRVLVADVAMECDKVEAYDRLELIRDPSHTHALTREELAGLFSQSGLLDCRTTNYGVHIKLEDQLRASFPKPGDELVLREMVVNDIGVDRLGINARREGGEVIYTVPISVYVGRKGAA